MLVQSPWWIEKNARRVWFVFGRFGWEGCVPEITMRWKNCQDWDTSLELKNPNQQTCPIWGDIHRLSRSDKLRDSWPDAYVCVGQNWMPNLEESLHLTARVWRMLRSQHSGTDPKLRNMRVTVTPTGLSWRNTFETLCHFMKYDFMSQGQGLSWEWTLCNEKLFWGTSIWRRETSEVIKPCFAWQRKFSKVAAFIFQFRPVLVQSVSRRNLKIFSFEGAVQPLNV